MGKRETLAAQSAPPEAVCRACIGMGRVKVYRHRCSNRKFGAGPQGYRAYPCPACGGTGVRRVWEPVRQEVAA